MKIRPVIWKVCGINSTVLSTKENFALFMIALGLWILSFSVLLPFVFVLMISSSLRKSLYRWNMQYKNEGIDVLSKQLFSILRDSCPQFDFRKLHFLELGARTPSDEYSEQHEIDVASDYSKENRKLDGVSKKIRICSENDVLERSKENTYDVVISTFYLCSVKNPRLALNNIRRILKPGGKFAFLEHCGYPENEFAHKCQRLIAPFWQILLGCRLSHHLSHLLMQASFHAINFKTYYNEERLIFYRPVIVGVCTK